ncbi:tetratricopeptide repeat protein [[Eubacterium] cellulosolvens]
MDKETKINEMEITDEFLKADSKETIGVVAQKLRQLQAESDSEGGTILITQNDDEVIGFITPKELLDAIAEGKNPGKLRASELMNTDFVEVLEDETLGQIMPLIQERYPNAMVVIDSERRCVGFFSKNDYKDAMAALGVYNKSKKPKTANDWRTKGIAMSSLGKRLEALKSYEKSLLAESNKEKGWTSLAKRLERINRHKDAIMCLDKALEMNSKNDEALTEKGNIYSKQNMENLAIKSYERALEINPDNGDAYMFLGMEQANLGFIDQAMKSLDMAVSIKGPTAELWFKKGKIYEKAKKFEDALDCYNRAIVLDNDFEDAWFNKGVTLNKLGKDSETLRCLRRILEINPSNDLAKEAISNYKEKNTFDFL